MAVRARWPGATAGSAIPTWFYGHEPPNVFAGGIAKFFQNSVREATLLRRCDGGIVFLPGAAGTVQEIFQDACENYYAEPDWWPRWSSSGVEHWTDRCRRGRCSRPSRAGRPMATRIALVDTVDDAARCSGGDGRANAEPRRDRAKSARDLV